MAFIPTHAFPSFVNSVDHEEFCFPFPAIGRTQGYASTEPASYACDFSSILELQNTTKHSLAN